MLVESLRPDQEDLALVVVAEVAFPEVDLACWRHYHCPGRSLPVGDRSLG